MPIYGGLDGYPLSSWASKCLAPSGSTVWGGLGSVALLKEVCQWRQL